MEESTSGVEPPDATERGEGSAAHLPSGESSNPLNETGPVASSSSTGNVNRIQSFRTVIDENGEISYVFESDSEDSATEAVNIYQEPDFSSDSSREDYATVSVAQRVCTSHSNRHSNTLHLPVQTSDSEDDPDYAPSNVLFGDLSTTTTPSRGLFLRAITLATNEEPIAGPSHQRPRRYLTRRKRRRKPAKPKKKKVAKGRVKRPRRPLVPKTIVRPHQSTTDEEIQCEAVIAGCHYRCNINIAGEIDDVDFLIGSLELELTDPERAEFPCFKMESVLTSIPGVVEIILHINEVTDQCVLVVKTRTSLSDEVCEEIKRSSKLKRSEQRRKYYFIDEKKHYNVINLSGAAYSNVFGGLSVRKLFRLDLVSYDNATKLLKLNVVLVRSSVASEHFINDGRERKLDLIAKVIQFFCKINPIANDNVDQTVMQGKEDIEWFYGQVKKYHRQELLPDFLDQQYGVTPLLREYQKEAVKWMLFREKAYSMSETDAPELKKLDVLQAFKDKIYLPLKLAETAFNCDFEGTVSTLYYNPYLGRFAWTCPRVAELTSGGILCDEMGLGKTVEMLSLILLNQRKDLKDHFEQGNENSGNLQNKSRKGKKSSKKGVPKRDTEKGTSKLKHKDYPLSPSVSPTKRKRRSPSPCEFETMNFDTPPVKKIVIDKADLEIKGSNTGSPKKKTQRRSSRKSEEQQQHTSTYERVKVLYDTVLHQYAEAPVVTKRFHGQFFNPNIEVKPSFECLCGEAKEDNIKRIVTCAICSSSQHADCVGFEAIGRKVQSQYLCPHCTANEVPLDAKTTLIVTPPTISHQWVQEIQKHVRNTRLKIYFYKGVQSCGYIPPEKLASYDIIITTYGVLTTELNYVDLPHCSSSDSRQFRNPKRYLTIPSPLLSIKWWRLCLDEAQMVEGSTTKVATMTLRLQSIHRWCVTGTPMSRGLEDLFGLFVFLEIPWLNIEFWWNSLISKPFYQKKNSEILFEIFGQLIWRTCKPDVLDQLGIPEQSAILHWSVFSPLEAHFYKRQFEVCSAKIIEKINDKRMSCNIQEDFLGTKLAELDRNTLHALLQPFLVLRQACVHPQMVKGNWISLNKLKGTLTMEDLLDQLIKKSALQCTEDNRLIISSLNALAGLYWLEENYKEAANKYREVLQQERKYKDKFKTDKLQMVHTLENLANLLDLNPAGVGYTLRDDSLRSEANDLKNIYLQGYAADVNAARIAVVPFTISIEEIDSQLSVRKESWWVATLARVSRMGREDTLIDRIMDQLSDKATKRKTNTGSILNQFNDLNGLEGALIGKIIELDDLRKSVHQALEDLKNLDPNTIVEGAALCHLRKQKNPAYGDYNERGGGYTCTLCAYHDRFLKYESVLFLEERTEKITRTGRNWQKVKLAGRTLEQLSQDELDAVLLQEQEELLESTEHAKLKETLKRGHWGPSETERLLAIILSFAKTNGGSKWSIDDGNNHIKLLDAAKREFKLNRILWRKIYDQVSALDELQQATMRLRLASPSKVRQPKTPGTSTASGSSRRKATAPKRQLDYDVAADEKIININIIGVHEIEHRKQQAELDLANGKQNLAVHVGQIIYLETLKKNDYGKKGTANNDDCTICCNQLGYEWSVLICGHSFCTECVKKMCPNPMQSFQCPMCRISMKFKDISFVDTKEEKEEPSVPSNQEPQPSTSQGTQLQSTSSGNGSSVDWNNVQLPREVKGSHSSKVLLILEILLKLQVTHPGEKVIIFSSWLEVLEIISRALDENEIQYCLLTSGKAFKETLNRFKTRDYIQALLMPMASGSKGLNIIEATHVFLVEPTMNLANELQAIGRIHRIGQTKRTYVHRFYVRNTIEEHLYEILKTHDITSDDEGSLTVADLDHLVRK